MNTRVVVSTLVGGLLLFAWQSLSWTVLPLHTQSLRYTAGQDSILALMAQHMDQTGMYYLPSPNPEDGSGSSYEEMETAMKGKPVAQVNFIQAYESNMGLNMGIGLLLSVLSALIISLVLARHTMGSALGRFAFSLGIGVILIAQDTLGDVVWWFHPAHWYVPEIIDYLAMFSLAGIWFAWYWGRSPAPR